MPKYTPTQVQAALKTLTTAQRQALIDEAMASLSPEERAVVLTKAALKLPLAAMAKRNRK